MYTKGEWKVSEPTKSIPRTVSSDERYPIARIYGTQDDARLIAAAPKLLEACKYAFENLKPAGGVKKDFSGHLAVAGLSEAIHEAEGE